MGTPQKQKEEVDLDQSEKVGQCAVCASVQHVCVRAWCEITVGHEWVRPGERNPLGQLCCSCVAV